MKIALIGATGNAGSRILAELSRRGHAVTAIARHPEKVPALTGVTALKQMGVVMKTAQAKLAGKRVDGKALSEKVRARLS